MGKTKFTDGKQQRVSSNKGRNVGLNKATEFFSVPWDKEDAAGK